MVWKPKERELTEEEAIEEAIKELRPLWHHSEPLFAVVFEGEGQDDRPMGEPRLFPLEKNFRARRWLLFFYDPTRFSDRAVHSHLRELIKRYAQQAITPILVLPGHFRFLRENLSIQHVLRSLKIEGIVVSDVEGRIARAFGIQASPAFALVDRGATPLLSQGIRELSRFEGQLQTFLRGIEPGVSFFPTIQTEGVLRDERLSAEFASGNLGGLRFSHDPGPLVEGAFVISNPLFSASLLIPGPELGLILEPASSDAVAHVVIESGGMPIYDSYYGEELRMDDEGRTGFVVNEPKLYRATKGLPDRFRNISIRFPGADKMPVRWYGIRVAEPLQKPSV
jgi:hypothetical protein